MPSYEQFERDCNERPTSARSTHINQHEAQGRQSQVPCCGRSRTQATPRPAQCNNNENPNLNYATPVAARDTVRRRRLEFDEPPPESYLTEEEAENTEDPNQNSKCYNSSGRPFNLKDLLGGVHRKPPCSRYNASGEALRLSDFGEDQNRNQGPRCDMYDASGRALKLSDFCEDQNRNQGPQCNRYEASGQALRLSDFAEDQNRNQGPRCGKYDASGQALRLSDFAEDQNRNQGPRCGKYDASGQALRLSDFAEDQNRNQGPRCGKYDASGQALRLSDFAEDQNRNQGPRCGKYDASGQALRLSDFAEDQNRNQGPRCDMYNSSGQALRLTDFAGDQSQSQEMPSGNFGCTSGHNMRPDSFRINSDIVGGRDSSQTSQGFDEQISPIRDFTCPPCNRRTMGEQSAHRSRIPEGFVDVDQSQRRNLSSSLQMPSGNFGCTSGQMRPESFRVNSDIPGFDSSQISQGFDEPISPIRDAVCARGNSRSTGAQSPHHHLRFQDGNADVDHSNRRNLSSGVQNGRNRETVPQNRLVQSLKNGDLNHLLPARGAHKNPLYNSLVIDNYFPGAIDDAVNGEIDFNQIVFDTVFECNVPTQLSPDDVPLTLLEAFELRIQYESDLEETREKLKEFCKNLTTTRPVAEAETEGKDGEGGKHLSWKHRDELKLASTIDIDLSCNTHDYPETELTQAIASLLRAEKINDFDEKVRQAEQAVDLAAPDEKEKAAIKSTCSFHINMHKDESVAASSNTYKPIEIVSYVGTTQPSSD